MTRYTVRHYCDGVDLSPRSEAPRQARSLLLAAWRMRRRMAAMGLRMNICRAPYGYVLRRPGEEVWLRRCGPAGSGVRSGR